MIGSPIEGSAFLGSLAMTSERELSGAGWYSLLPSKKLATIYLIKFWLVSFITFKKESPKLTLSARSAAKRPVDFEVQKLATRIQCRIVWN
jgi:hypothetical protein